jgi:hypothetical protein
MYHRHYKSLSSALLLAVATSCVLAAPLKVADMEKKIELDVEWITSPKPTIQADNPQPGATPVWPEEQSAQWEIQRLDKTLSTVMARWSQKAGWQLVWDAERDFPIENHIMLEGTFVQVVQTVMDSLNDSDYPLQAALNPSTRVIRITRYLEPRRK